MKKIISSKSPLFLAACLLIIIVTVGGVIAFLTVKSHTVVNTFKPGEVACEVSESFSGTTKEDVKICNTGDADACIRAKVVASWVKTDESGNVVAVSGQKPKAGQDYIIDAGDFTSGKWVAVSGSTTSSSWNSDPETTFYYTTTVAPNGYTANLIDSVTLSDTADVPDGFKLSIDVLAEAVQAEPSDAVSSAWGVSSDMFSKGGA